MTETDPVRAAHRDVFVPKDRPFLASLLSDYVPDAALLYCDGHIARKT